ncbi:hypothetical protein C7C46_29395 [Streptomyces tateyamensis]|uniref:Uncharacterized protein n=1 Tax=Streptomyces tateyamensis TaxID=565073 RepID=A0A2V4NI84_9ACTN|nr:hypothetical protein [Streptomyces tateyamensis]PYC68214.1 hypothetical protein C7C46_29395 [Streptomyces tateyamensis]
MDRRTPSHRTTSRSRRSRRLLAAGALLCLAAGVAGCSSSTSSKVNTVASSAAGAAQSALASVGSQAASQASSALSAGASAASSAFAGATAGADATGDVTLGTVTMTADGKAQVPVTVKNSQSSAQRYTIEVDFKDQGGGTLDIAVLNPGPVDAGQTANATATSNRKLSGTVVANVARAVRY